MVWINCPGCKEQVDVILRVKTEHSCGAAFVVTRKGADLILEKFERVVPKGLGDALGIGTRNLPTSSQQTTSQPPPKSSKPEMPTQQTQTTTQSKTQPQPTPQQSQTKPSTAQTQPQPTGKPQQAQTSNTTQGTEPKVQNTAPLEQQVAESMEAALTAIQDKIFLDYCLATKPFIDKYNAINKLSDLSDKLSQANALKDAAKMALEAAKKWPAVEGEALKNVHEAGECEPTKYDGFLEQYNQIRKQVLTLADPAGKLTAMTALRDEMRDTATKAKQAKKPPQPTAQQPQPKSSKPEMPTQQPQTTTQPKAQPQPQTSNTTQGTEPKVQNTAQLQKQVKEAKEKALKAIQDQLFINYCGGNGPFISQYNAINDVTDLSNQLSQANALKDTAEKTLEAAKEYKESMVKALKAINDKLFINYCGGNGPFIDQYSAIGQVTDLSNKLSQANTLKDAAEKSLEAAKKYPAVKEQADKSCDDVGKFQPNKHPSFINQLKQIDDQKVAPDDDPAGKLKALTALRDEMGDTVANAKQALEQEIKESMEKALEAIQDEDFRDYCVANKPFIDKYNAINKLTDLSDKLNKAQALQETATKTLEAAGKYPPIKKEALKYVDEAGKYEPGNSKGFLDQYNQIQNQKVTPDGPMKKLTEMTALRDEKRDTATKGKKVKDARELTKNPSALSSLVPLKKVELLRDLRGHLPGPPKGKLDRDQRLAQREVYNSMELDPNFEKVEIEKRKTVLENVKKSIIGDPSLKGIVKDWDSWQTQEKDLETAKDRRRQELKKVDWNNWEKSGTKKPPADLIAKKKLLEAVLAIQCKEMGIPVPEVVFDIPQAPTKNPGGTRSTTPMGHFSPTDGKIHLNPDPDGAVKDFKEALDTIIHENTHNYQAHLVKELEAKRLTDKDPRYIQALIFQANNEPEGYFSSDSADKTEQEKNATHAAYEKQPVEEHAWKAGLEAQVMAQEIMKECK